MERRRAGTPPANPAGQSGGNYSSDGPTVVNPEGDTMGTAEEELAEEGDDLTPED